MNGTSPYTDSGAKRKIRGGQRDDGGFLPTPVIPSFDFYISPGQISLVWIEGRTRKTLEYGMRDVEAVNDTSNIHQRLVSVERELEKWSLAILKKKYKQTKLLKPRWVASKLNTDVGRLSSGKI